MSIADNMPDLSLKNRTFDKKDKQGWLTGFTTLFQHENQLWWGTKRWIWQSLIWFIIIDGSVLLGHNEAIDALTGSISIAGAIGVIILAQSTILGEKQTGTAVWILSKPVTRISFILAKLLAYTIGFTITISVLQGLTTYLLFAFILHTALSISGFIAAFLLLSLNLLFYLCLTLMMGTLVNSWAWVMGPPLFLLLLQELARNILWPFTLVLPISFGPLENQFLTGGSPVLDPFVLPILATVCWCVLFISIAIWRFEREEF